MAKSALRLVVDNPSIDHPSAIAAGDVIRTGENSYPRYRIVAISDDKAWIRDVQAGGDHIVPLGRCHLV